MNTSSNIMSLNTASGTKTVSTSSSKSVKNTSSNKSSKQDSFSNVLDKSTGDESAKADTGINADDAAKDPISAAIVSAQSQGNVDEAGQSNVEGEEPSMAGNLAESNAAETVMQTLMGNSSQQTAVDSRLMSNSIEALMGNAQNESSSAQGNQLLEMLGGSSLLQTQSLQQNSLKRLTADTQAAMENDMVSSGLSNSTIVADSAEASTVENESLQKLLGDTKVELVQTDSLGQNNTVGQQMKANFLAEQQSFQQGEQSAFAGDEVLQENTPQTSSQAQAQGNTGISAFQQTFEIADVDGAQQIQETQQARNDYDIPKQIVDQARLIRSGENTEMVIKLRPEHLGNLTLRISVTGDGAVNASFHSDNAQVRAIIESSMVQLKQDLENQGLKVNNVEVYSGLSDGLMQGGQSQPEYQQQSNAAQHSKLDMDSFEDDVEQLSDVAEHNSGTEDGVDYRV